LTLLVHDADDDPLDNVSVDSPAIPGIVGILSKVPQ